MSGPDFRALRKACGATQADFAKALGVKKRAIGYWETGRRAPPETVVRLAACIRAMGWAEYLAAVGGE